MVVITSPDAIPAVRLTVDEYLQADLPEGYRYEFVDGEVVMSPNPGGLHEEIIFHLSTILHEYCSTHRDTIALISFNSGVPIPGMDRVREPDLAVYTNWEGQGRGWEVWKEFVPVLVIEVVSPDQEKRDYHEKRAARLDQDVEKVSEWLQLNGYQTDQLRGILTSQYEREDEVRRLWEEGADDELLGDQKRSGGEQFRADLANVFTPEQLDTFWSRISGEGKD